MISEEKQNQIEGMIENGMSAEDVSNKLKVAIQTARRYIRLVKNRNKEPKRAPKILLFDIETAMMSIWVWGILYKQKPQNHQIIEDWFCLSWAGKWLFDNEIMSDIVTPEEALKRDDNRIMGSMWKLIDEADIVIGHNCVEESTPILTTNLKWIPAGKLKVGDSLVGFTENKSRNTPRQIRESIVTHHSIERRKCMKVTFSNGDEAITTPEHPWLKLAPKGRDYRWCETKNLKVGQRVNKFMKPWKEDTSFEGRFSSTETITKIEHVGEKKVAVMGTSTKTYFAAGYPMHNSKKFDHRKVNARFIKYGFNPPTPYRIIDTIKVAKKHFAFTSYSLDYLCEYFNIRRKLPTDYNLWKKCLQGDAESLKYMQDYNKQDILSLEDLFLKLRPYLTSVPNLGLYINNDDGKMCPICSSEDIIKEGIYTTSVSVFQSYRCLKCGGLSRGRNNLLNKEKMKNLLVPTAR